MGPSTYSIVSFWQRSKLCLGLFLFTSLMLPINPLHAQNVILDFGSLPSAQGWTYVGANPENNIFNVSSNTLHQNPIGTGNSASYYILPTVDVTKSFTLDFRGRIFQEELGGPLESFGFAVEVDYISRSFTIGLGTNRVILHDNSNSRFIYSIDTSVFHDYRLTGNPLTYLWQLSIDGTPVGSGSAASFNRSNDLAFGDISSGANAQGEWTRLEFSQVAVPEPGTIFLTSASAICFGIYLWRRKRQLARLAME